MSYRFSKHYSREEARAMLPALRAWLDQLNDHRLALEKNEQRLTGLVGGGQDSGGGLVNDSVRRLADIKDLFRKFQEREIIIKDLGRGLVDFPALINDREVFLCWEKDEQDIEHWHDLDSGYAGRERL